MLERNSFVLKRVRNYGDDYGGSHCSEDTETTYDEIDAESIIVKNGHFAGVAIISEYDYYTGGSDNKLKDSVPKADKNHGQTEKTTDKLRKPGKLGGVCFSLHFGYCLVDLLYLLHNQIINK